MNDMKSDWLRWTAGERFSFIALSVVLGCTGVLLALVGRG